MDTQIQLLHQLRSFTFHRTSSYLRGKKEKEKEVIDEEWNIIIFYYYFFVLLLFNKKNKINFFILYKYILYSTTNWKK